MLAWYNRIANERLFAKCAQVASLDLHRIINS